MRDHCGALITGSISLAAIALAAVADTESQDVMIPTSLFVVPLGIAATAIGTEIGASNAPEKWMPRVTVETGTRDRQARVGLRVGF